jgi:hypothetical protein
MAEGFVSADGTAGTAVHDNREIEPAPSAEAPRGWTWNRQARSWKPKVRGRILWFEGNTDSPPDAVRDDVQDTDGFAGGTPDPEPSWMAEPDPPRPPDFQPSREQRADIKALVALCYTIPAETLPLVDPYCFGPLAERDTAVGVIDAVSDIVCASPKVAKWAASASGLMPWIKLSFALKPVGLNMLHHHLTKSVEVEIDRKAREMTVTERDWSQFSAA